MQTMAEAWIEEGRQEGRQEGKIEARVDLILLLLRRRFQPTEEMLQSLAQQLAEIHNEEILGQLLDAALDVLVLPDFIVKLRTVLPNTTTHN